MDPRYHLRRVRPGDRKPITQLVLSIDGITEDPGRAAMLREMINRHATNTDKMKDTYEAEVVNQKNGYRLTVTMLARMSVAAAAGRAVGMSYLHPPVDWAGSRRTLRTSVRARFNERLNELNLLAVHPGHQGKGIGTALLEEAEERSRAAGYRALMVMVYDDTGTAPATEWYRQRGFTFGLPGVPWCVRPFTDQPLIEVEYDHLASKDMIGFKPLHPGVAVESARLRSSSALGVRHAALPTIAGLLDE